LVINIPSLCCGKLASFGLLGLAGEVDIVADYGRRTNRQGSASLLWGLALSFPCGEIAVRRNETQHAQKPDSIAKGDSLECPLWVISGHLSLLLGCPLYVAYRT